MNTEKNGGNTPVLKPLRGEFTDDAYWMELCDKTRYVLPKPGVPATAENIRLWLNRLEIKEADYREAMSTNITDMIALNPDWPLRAFVGLLLEYKFTS